MVVGGGFAVFVSAITGDHIKKDQMLFVKTAKYIPDTWYQVGFCVYRRSYLVFPMVPRNSGGFLLWLLVVWWCVRVLHNGG